MLSWCKKDLVFLQVQIHISVSISLLITFVKVLRQTDQEIIEQDVQIAAEKEIGIIPPSEEEMMMRICHAIRRQHG